ncbi:hypothetical protein ACFTTN_33010 [Streptomyces niveus]|uniref:hypothetical protein n=1 Tax=Streptomyces niveus TaxID=193462 RepID=UPI003635F982
MAVDDAHVADRSSLRLLAHTARRLTGLPILLSSRGNGKPAQLDRTTAQPQCGAAAAVRTAE